MSFVMDVENPQKRLTVANDALDRIQKFEQLLDAGDLSEFGEEPMTVGDDKKETTNELTQSDVMH